MIAQPAISTPSPPQRQASQAQPQASANGFLALLAPDNASLLASAPAGNTPPAVTPANNNKPGSANNNNGNSTAATPYMTAPTATTIVPTAAINQAAPATPSNGDPSAASATNANQLLLNGTSIPSNPVLPASDPQAADAGNRTNDANGASGTNGASSTNGNSTDFGASVNARIAAGAPIYASQPSATMATVPPHLLNAATPETPAGAPAKTGADAAQKPATDPSDAPMPPSPGAATAGATAALHPSHVAADQSPTGSAGNQGADNTTPTAAADSANGGGNGGDAGAASTALAAQPNAPISTPAQIDAAVHTAAPYVPVGEQVALNLKQALAADNNEIRIQLKPASLGTIDVKLNLTQDGRVSAVISADRSDTLNMLKQDSGSLQQSLRDAGLNADSSSLSFNLRGDAQSFAQNSPQGGFSRGGGNTSGSAYLAAGSDNLSATGSTLASQSYHNGSLDIEV
ncbi:MAG TPA: flagellar hook-length control protein FliK [Stellaceae bacterium]|nr:flagellar hook-length control protein FliK [Stellaceae bacterium]